MTASAATRTKANNTTSLNQPGSWSGGVPGSGDIALWDGTYNQNNATLSLGGDLGWGGIQITSAKKDVTIGVGNTLTLYGSGIDMTAASMNLTLNCALTLGAAQSWNVNNGRLLTVGGNVNNGSFLLTIGGAGDTPLPVLSATGAAV